MAAVTAAWFELIKAVTPIGTLVPTADALLQQICRSQPLARFGRTSPRSSQACLRIALLCGHAKRRSCVVEVWSWPGVGRSPASRTSEAVEAVSASVVGAPEEALRNDRDVLNRAKLSSVQLPFASRSQCPITDSVVKEALY